MKKGLIRRSLCVVLALVLSFIICGCSDIFSDNDAELLSPPKLVGEMEPIQDALESGVGGRFTLKYPSQGDIRSAITMGDLDGDGKSEAIAFYSTSTDNAVTMHIAVISNQGDKWQFTAEQKIVANSVESVVIKDMDGDGKNEIIVGWRVYGNNQRQVSVYQYTANSLMSLLDEPYTVFLVCDLNDDFTSDILIINQDTLTSKAWARYFGITNTGVNELGTCEMDGSITSYYTPVISKLSTGDSCVYVDSVKGAGVLTEILLFKDGSLVNALYNPEANDIPVTQRSSAILCRDFDGDGVVEIPLMTVFPTVEFYENNDKAYLTAWSTFDGESFITKASRVINYNDGYYLEFDDSFYNNITVIRNTEGRQRLFYLYDYETETVGEELFSIYTASKTAYSTGQYASDSYIKLAESESMVYILRLGTAAGGGLVNENIIKEAFSLISEE